MNELEKQLEIEHAEARAELHAVLAERSVLRAQDKVLTVRQMRAEGRLSGLNHALQMAKEHKEQSNGTDEGDAAAPVVTATPEPPQGPASHYQRGFQAGLAAQSVLTSLSQDIAGRVASHLAQDAALNALQA